MRNEHVFMNATRFVVGFVLWSAHAMAATVSLTGTQVQGSNLEISLFGKPSREAGLPADFVVKVGADRTLSRQVGGNCPPGTWSSTLEKAPFTYSTYSIKGPINASCNAEFSSTPRVASSGYALTLEFARIDQPSPNPFDVTVHLSANGEALPGQTLTLNVPQGKLGSVSDSGKGTYVFRVTPKSDGVYPVEVSFHGVTVKRSAIVATGLGKGVGQPLAVPGEFVNTEGYEDGPNITPDGQYLFVQTGPISVSGLLYLSSICPKGIATCATQPDNNLVFNTFGPYSAPLRPGFPTGAIANQKLTHYQVPGTTGVPIFPTILYGFKKQNDGTFAEPFRVTFNDEKGANHGTGINVWMTSPTTADYVLGWNNSSDDKRDDIYYGSMTLGHDTILGDVSYSPKYETKHNMTQLSLGNSQSNPFMYRTSSGKLLSIWVDDEDLTKKITVYKLASGSVQSGSWDPVVLPGKINTAGGVHMPFFTGSRLYLMRGPNIVYHDYIGSGGMDYGLDSSWGKEVVVLQGSSSAKVGSIYAFGEPTIATPNNGKKYLYFTYMRVRALGSVTGRVDLNSDIGFVEIP